MIKNLIHSWWFYKLLIGADFSKIIVSKVGGGEKTKHNNLINVPLYSSHPLPKAVLLLCKAVQMSLSPLKGEGAIACLSYCDRGSSYLCSSISVALAQSGNWLNKVGYQQFQTWPLHSYMQCMQTSKSLPYITSYCLTVQH